MGISVGTPGRRLQACILGASAHRGRIFVHHCVCPRRWDRLNRSLADMDIPHPSWVPDLALLVAANLSSLDHEAYLSGTIQRLRKFQSQRIIL